MVSGTSVYVMSALEKRGFNLLFDQQAIFSCFACVEDLFYRPRLLHYILLQNILGVYKKTSPT